MTDGLRIAHLRIAPQWAILRWGILTFSSAAHMLNHSFTLFKIDGKVLPARTNVILFKYLLHRWI